MLLKIFALLAVASLSVAQSSSAKSTAPSSPSSSAAATHTVSVGADGINYTPNQLNASAGDIVRKFSPFSMVVIQGYPANKSNDTEFRFYPQNHSVARAEYKLPCIPYEFTGAGKVGFWSGYKPTSVVSNDVCFPSCLEVDLI